MEKEKTTVEANVNGETREIQIDPTKVWNVVSIDLVDAPKQREAIQQLLTTGWEPFQILQEPVQDPLNPRGMRVKQVMWLKKQGLLPEDETLKAKKPDLGVVN